MAAHISQQYCLDILSKRKCDLTYDESFGLIPKVKKMLYMFLKKKKICFCFCKQKLGFGLFLQVKSEKTFCNCFPKQKNMFLVSS